ncbi:MAG: hypothetical protein EPGJADBJ_05439 [Saprospiraceae bacterium]|nr:hypothetical protein [Saprospiraceae bacterium]
MSGTRLRSQGLKLMWNSPSLGAKASLAGFQWIELASGEMATPASPMPPARLSTEIIRKGTAVVMVLRSWPQGWPVTWLMQSELTCARDQNGRETAPTARGRRLRDRE